MNFLEVPGGSREVNTASPKILQQLLGVTSYSTKPKLPPALGLL